MRDNLRLEIARRRNLLKREGDKFLSDISNSLALTYTQPVLVDPEASVVLGNRMLFEFEKRRKDGTLVRSIDVDWLEVSRSVERLRQRLGNATGLAIFLNNHMQLPIAQSFQFLAENLFKLLEFDADALYAVSFHDDFLLLIDRHPLPGKDEIKYDIEYSF